MWTNKNTPLMLAAAVAVLFVAIGALAGTQWSLGLGIVLAVCALMLGTLSRHMTHLWLTDDVRLWARHIRGFEKADHKQMPPEDGIVFVGSSTIRFWKTLAEDMSPLQVIQRGFGGSRILDAVHYADRIIIPYKPAGVVVFSGTNDLAGKTAKTAAYVADKFKEFCKVVHDALPAVPIYYVSIIPTPGRMKHWPAVQEANRLIEQHTQTDERLHFIDAALHFLSDSGEPTRSLYRWDGVHLSPAGYAVLTGVIKSILEQDFSAKMRT